MGAERTCVCRIPKRCKNGQDTMQVVGAKGEGFKVSFIKQVKFEGTNKIGIGNVLLVPEAGCSLLGWDLQVQLDIGVLPEEAKMVVKLLQLREEEKKIHKMVWAKLKNRGKLNMKPMVIEIVNENHPVQVRQYSLSLEGRRGLWPVIQGLLEEGTLEPCMSPHNTPILPVEKSNETYGLVQDLREVNKRTVD